MHERSKFHELLRIVAGHDGRSAVVHQVADGVANREVRAGRVPRDVSLLVRAVYNTGSKVVMRSRGVVVGLGETGRCLLRWGGEEAYNHTHKASIDRSRECGIKDEAYSNKPMLTFGQAKKRVRAPD